MPTNNPNFGTGYVDWSSYVNANQPGVDAARSQVANYMQGLDTQARQQLPTMPDQSAPDQQAGQLAGHAKTYAAPGTDPFGVAQENLATNQQALSTPGGFQQVLAQANAAYDPIKGAAAGKGPPKAEFDPFSAALEGQNAGSLYNPSSPVAPTAPGGGGGPGKALPTAGPLPSGSGPNSDQPSGTPEGPGGGKPRRGTAVGDVPDNPNNLPQASNPWGSYVQPFNPRKRGTP